jgi:hypothetical protein
MQNDIGDLIAGFLPADGLLSVVLALDAHDYMVIFTSTPN